MFQHSSTLGCELPAWDFTALLNPKIWSLISRSYVRGWKGRRVGTFLEEFVECFSLAHETSG